MSSKLDVAHYDLVKNSMNTGHHTHHMSDQQEHKILPA